MSERAIPNFGALLGVFIAQVPEPARPRFLALLERGAAERYRYWAERLPEHQAGLVACSAREDEIADRVERVFAIDDAVREKMNTPLAGARETYYSVFEGLPLLEQLRIQANAERQGAAAWRGIASGVADAHVREELERCARLEETSADYLDRLVSS